jgi:coenzyme F420-reducing hydrogenase gamma subunit
MLTSIRKKRRKGFEFLTGKAMQSQGGYEKTFLLGQCMIKANRSNPKIRHAIPIPGCPPTMEDLVKILKENGVEIDMEDYHRYRKHLFKKFKSKSQFNPKDFFE